MADCISAVHGSAIGVAPFLKSGCQHIRVGGVSSDVWLSLRPQVGGKLCGIGSQREICPDTRIQARVYRRVNGTPACSEDAGRSRPLHQVAVVIEDPESARG